MEGTGIVEGVMRYHPFLYDKETYPLDINAYTGIDIYLRMEQSFLTTMVLLLKTPKLYKDESENIFNFQ